jgi:hypothetical protein
LNTILANSNVNKEDATNDLATEIKNPLDVHLEGFFYYQYLAYIYIMNKKQNQVGIILNVKNNKRKIQRKMEIEDYQLQIALDELEWRFYQELFLKEGNNNVFHHYDLQWKSFCKGWNSKGNKHLQTANHLAFHEKNINSTLNNKYDKPIKFDNPKLFTMFGIL